VSQSAKAPHPIASALTAFHVWLAARRASVEAWFAARRSSVEASLAAAGVWLHCWFEARRAWWHRYRDAHASSPVQRYLDAHRAMVARCFELQPLAGLTRWIDARRDASHGALRSVWSALRQIRYALPTLAAVALIVFAMGGRWRFASAAPPSQNEALSSVTPSSSTPSSSGASSPVTSPSVTLPSGTSSVTPSSAAMAASTSSVGHGPTAPSSQQGAKPSPGAAAMFGGARPWKKPAIALTGKLNLNTATAEQLLMLPTVGPAKAERIIKWRTMNGGFRRIADIRRVKGFGYKTFRRLEAFLDVSGENTLQ
jgi:competence protein ComEA